MWGRGLIWSNGACSTLCPVFSHSLCYPQSNCALLVLLPKWVGLCIFEDTVGLSNKLSCEAGSFSPCHLNPHRCFQLVVWGFIFPSWNSGLWGLSPVDQLLPCWPAAGLCTVFHNPPPCWVHQLPPCCETSPSGCPSPPLLLVWINVSSLSPWLSDFHNSSILYQFWLFFVFKLLSFFWLCEEVQCVYLCLHLGWKSRIILVFKLRFHFCEAQVHGCPWIP